MHERVNHCSLNDELCAAYIKKTQFCYKKQFLLFFNFNETTFLEMLSTTKAFELG